MEIVLYVIIAAVAGGVFGYIIRNKEIAKLISEADFLKKDIEKNTAELTEKQKEINAIQAQMTEYVSRAVKAEAEKKALEESLEREKENHDTLTLQAKEYNSEILKTMKSQFYELAVKTLNERSEELKRTNAEQISGIVMPVKEVHMKKLKSCSDGLDSQKKTRKFFLNSRIFGKAFIQLSASMK